MAANRRRICNFKRLSHVLLVASAIPQISPNIALMFPVFPYNPHIIEMISAYSQDIPMIFPVYSDGLLMISVIPIVSWLGFQNLFSSHPSRHIDDAFVDKYLEGDVQSTWQMLDGVGYFNGRPCFFCNIATENGPFTEDSWWFACWKLWLVIARAWKLDIGTWETTWIQWDSHAKTWRLNALSGSIPGNIMEYLDCTYLKWI